MPPREGSPVMPPAPRSKRIGIGIILHGNQVLVGTRAPDQVLGGMQEFPGGKCEPGESPAACTIRECLEETGLRVEIDELLIHSQHDYSHGRVELSFFLCRLADSKTVSQGNFRWVPMGELALLNFPDGNREAVTTLLAREAERPGGVA